MPQATKLKKYEEVLMAALKFTEGDLAANMGGRLSAAQVTQFKQRRSTYASFSALLFGTVAAAMMLISAVLFNGIVILLACGLLFALSGLLVGAVPVLNINRDLRLSVQMVEGRVDLDTTPARNSASYTVKVDDKKFKVKKRAFLAFKNGDPYRIYYTAHTKTILSADWLRDDDPFAEPNDNQRLEDVPVSEEEPPTPDAQSLPLRKEAR